MPLGAAAEYDHSRQSQRPASLAVVPGTTTHDECNANACPVSRRAHHEDGLDERNLWESRNPPEGVLPRSTHEPTTGQACRPTSCRRAFPGRNPEVTLCGSRLTAETARRSSQSRHSDAHASHTPHDRLHRTGDLDTSTTEATSACQSDAGKPTSRSTLERSSPGTSRSHPREEHDHPEGRRIPFHFTPDRGCPTALPARRPARHEAIQPSGREHGRTAKTNRASHDALRRRT